MMPQIEGPLSKGERLLPYTTWEVVSQIAGTLMAAGSYTNVEYAVRTAREIVAAAREATR